MANEQMRHNWGAGAAGWVANEQIFDRVFASFTDAVIGAVDPQPGDRVLDVGCGTGTLLQLAASRGAEVTGVDISPAMAEAAQQRVPDATLVVADAQTHDLLAVSPGGEPFTKVMSRFGVMFFEDPIAAFANIRSATSASGTLTFICWRSLAENPMFWLGGSVLTDRMDPKPPTPPPGAPGPTAFADKDWLASILSQAGWIDVAIEQLDGECNYGVDGTDGVEERMATILSGQGGRAAREQLEPRLGPHGWAALLDEVRAELRRHLVDGAVSINGATWLVTARNS